MKSRILFFYLLFTFWAILTEGQTKDSVEFEKTEFKVLVFSEKVEQPKSFKSELNIRLSINNSNDITVNPLIEINGVSFTLDKIGTGIIFLKPGTYKIGCRYYPFMTNQKFKLRVKKGYDYRIEIKLKKVVSTND